MRAKAQHGHIRSLMRNSMWTEMLTLRERDLYLRNVDIKKC